MYALFRQISKVSTIFLINDMILFVAKMIIATVLLIPYWEILKTAALYNCHLPIWTIYVSGTCIFATRASIPGLTHHRKT